MLLKKAFRSLEDVRDRFLDVEMFTSIPMNETLSGLKLEYVIALIYSRDDDDERQWARRVADRVRLLVETQGADGGVWSGESQGSWEATEPPGPPRDSYGCGDSFAAGFTHALSDGASVAEAAALGAECGARTLTRPGAP